MFLNGERLGRIEGGFIRGRFDVTGRIRPGGKNALAVRVEKNATPGSVKQKTLESAGPERRRAGRRQPDLPRLHRLGLDPDRPRARHRHLERRLPDRQRAGDHRESVRPDDSAAAGHLAGRRESGGVPRTTTIEAGERNAARALRRRRFRAAGDARPASTKTVVLDPSTTRRCGSRNPQAVVAERLRRAEPLQRRAEVRGGRQDLRHPSRSRPACGSSPTAKTAAR